MTYCLSNVVCDTSYNISKLYMETASQKTHLFYVFQRKDVFHCNFQKQAWKKNIFISAYGKEVGFYTSPKAKGDSLFLCLWYIKFALLCIELHCWNKLGPWLLESHLSMNLCCWFCWQRKVLFIVEGTTHIK